MGSETRDRIIAEAARLFDKQGFAATGISAILRDAGVKSGSLYHFFPSKEALLIAVLERYFERLRPTILDPVEATAEDPIDRLFALLERYRRDLLVSEYARGCPVGKLALEVVDRTPQTRTLMEAYFSGWADGVERWLEAAGDRLPANLDRLGLARHALAVVEGGVMQARAAGSIEPFDAAVGQLRSHVELLERRAGSERGASAKPPPAALPAPTPEEVVEASEEPGWRSW
jgi:AcrR family transcriptional regulator